MTEASRSRDGTQPLAGDVNIYQKPTYTVVKIVLHNPGEESVAVRLRQSLPTDLSQSHVTFPSKYHGDDWTFSPGQLEFETDIDSTATLRTAYGTKGVGLSSLKERIGEATVSIYEDGEEVGRLTGLQPTVVETAADATDSSGGDDDTESDERTAREIFGDDTTSETTDSWQPEGASSQQASASETGESEETSSERGDEALSAESIVDSSEERQTATDEGVRSSAETEEDVTSGTSPAESETVRETGTTQEETGKHADSETTPEETEEETGTPPEETEEETGTSPEETEVAFETPDGEPWVTITETGDSEDTTDSAATPEEETSDEPESGTKTATGRSENEPTEVGAETTAEGQPAKAATDESSVQWQSEPGHDEHAETTQSPQGTGSEFGDESTAETTDLPANRSHYVLEEVRGHIKSSSEFEWVYLDGEEPEETESKGILGRIRSWFSR